MVRRVLAAALLACAGPPAACAASGVAEILGPEGRVVVRAPAGAGFAYPADGSLVQVADADAADGSLVLHGISLLGGRLLVRAATVGAQNAVEGASADGVALAGTANQVVELPGAGWAIVLQRAAVPLAGGARREASVAVRLHLQAPVGGLRAGSDVLVGYAAGSVAAPVLRAAAAEIPPELVPIYRAAARRYGVPWSVLAAVNRVESSFGRDLRTSSAGAVGWMQFMPTTWASYGVDADGDGRADPFDPDDAIFSAANLLAADGAARDLEAAIWLYNHSTTYVHTVLELARAYDDGTSAPAGIADAARAADTSGGISPALLW